MRELVEAVTKLKPDGFTPTIVKQTDDYVYVEYQSPTFGVRGGAWLEGVGGGGGARACAPLLMLQLARRPLL